MEYSKCLGIGVLGLVCTVGCGDSGTETASASESASESASATIASTSDSTGKTTGDSGNSNSESATPTEDSGSVSMTGDSVPTTGTDDTTAAMTTTGVGVTTTGPDTTTTGPDTTGSPDSSTGEPPVPDMGEPCGGMNNVPDKGFLWAANSSQGTISKIDTETVTEVGRYIVRPDSNGSPSRTSVSITGDVAVANRNGGVTKIFSNPDNCNPDNNGVPGLQTSMNNQPLPWGQDDCLAWYTPFAYQSQRPVAWGAGEFNEQTCQYENEELWTAGRGGIQGIDVLILDGATGMVKDQLNVPTGGGGLNEDFFGIYGAAVDPDGNFWGSQLGSTGRLIRILRDDLSYQIWDTPNGPHWYGMSVDTDGRVWLCGNTVGRFDPLTETWQTAQVGGYAGCMADAGDTGLLWVSNGNGVVGVNRETLAVEKTWNAAGSYGVSIDFKGFVWVVAFGNTASKIDPDTGEFWTYNGLVGAYTYSDMTGFSLQANVLPQ